MLIDDVRDLAASFEFSFKADKVVTEICGKPPRIVKRGVVIAVNPAVAVRCDDQPSRPLALNTNGPGGLATGDAIA